MANVPATVLVRQISQDVALPVLMNSFTVRYNLILVEHLVFVTQKDVICWIGGGTIDGQIFSLVPEERFRFMVKHPRKAVLFGST